MIIRLKVNLGSHDASAIGVDFQQCQQGMTPEVSDSAGEWLISRGIAEPVREVRGVAKAAAIQGVPPETPKAKSKAKEIQSSRFETATEGYADKVK